EELDQITGVVLDEYVGSRPGPRRERTDDNLDLPRLQKTHERLEVRHDCAGLEHTANRRRPSPSQRPAGWTLVCHHPPNVEMSRLGLATIGVSILTACGGAATSPSQSSPAVAAGFSTYESAHLTFRYTSMDASSIGQTAAAVEAEYTRITGDLGVDGMPTVIV